MRRETERTLNRCSRCPFVDIDLSTVWTSNTTCLGSVLPLEIVGDQLGSLLAAVHRRLSTGAVFLALSNRLDAVGVQLVPITIN